MPKAVNIEIIGLNSHRKALTLLMTDLSYYQSLYGKELLQDMQEDMTATILPWSTPSQETINSFRILPSNISRSTTQVSLKNISPYAKVLIEGRTPKYIPIEKSEKLKAWVKDKLGAEFLKRHKYVLVGGVGSRVRLGNSQRDFLTPTITKFIDGGVKDRYINAGLKRALKDFETRASAKDRITITR